MAAAGKYRTGDLAVQRREERQIALLKQKFAVAAAQFDAIGGIDFVSRGGIDLHAIERDEQLVRFARRSLLRGQGNGAID